MLDLDLTLLESDKRFEQFCFRLAQYEFPLAVPIGLGGWDGGRDIVQFANREEGNVVFQCKFTRGNKLSKLKRPIEQSLDALNPHEPIVLWILCLPIDASGRFAQWLASKMRQYPFIKAWTIWGRQELLRRLEEYPDVLESFFYGIWKELEKRFRADELELIRFGLDDTCEWTYVCSNTLTFFQKGSQISDLVFDIIVRNRGTIDTLIESASLEVQDLRRVLHGIAGEGLLFPQITYTLSLNNGRPSGQARRLEPPLVVGAGQHARFRLRLADTGYAWNGAMRISLHYGSKKLLHLPWTRLFT